MGPTSADRLDPVMPRSEDGDVILGKIQRAKPEVSAPTNPAGVDLEAFGGQRPDGLRLPGGRPGPGGVRSRPLPWLDPHPPGTNCQGLDLSVRDTEPRPGGHYRRALVPLHGHGDSERSSRSGRRSAREARHSPGEPSLSAEAPCPDP